MLPLQMMTSVAMLLAACVISEWHRANESGVHRRGRLWHGGGWACVPGSFARIAVGEVVVRCSWTHLGNNCGHAAPMLSPCWAHAGPMLWPEPTRARKLEYLWFVLCTGL